MKSSPCEDILGTNWLRVAAWFVSVAAVVGNLAVVLVLLHASRRPVTVSKFLMVNLALADLCMGLYLILIVGMDFNTMGVYFNYAIDWQNGKETSLTHSFLRFLEFQKDILIKPSSFFYPSSKPLSIEMYIYID